MKLQDIYNKIDDLNETASMNISMSGDTANDVGVLLKMMQNAGLEKAGPVSDISDPNPRMDIEKFRSIVDMPGGDKHDHDGISHSHPGGDKDHDHDGPDMGPPEGDSPCGAPAAGPSDDNKGMDIIKLAGIGSDDKPEEDYANEPDEKYGDTKLMTKDLSGGLNGPKKAHPIAAPGDNPMAVRAELTRLEDTIKDELWKALEEKKDESVTEYAATHATAGVGKGTSAKAKASEPNTHTGANNAGKVFNKAGNALVGKKTKG